MLAEPGGRERKEAGKSMRTVRHVMDWLQGAGQPASSVDGLLAGSADAELKGVAVAFNASLAVLEKAAAAGANLLVVHEGICYSHDDRAEWSAGSRSAGLKRQWIRQAGLAVYRSHDGPHRRNPDWITEGLVSSLGWGDAVEQVMPAAAIVRLPEPSTARSVAEHIKRKLNVPWLRGIGGLDYRCSRIGIAVGYRGGGSVAVPLYEESGVDLVVAGEGPEWETPEYVRDSLHRGNRRSLLLLGHAASEEPGMRLLAERLQAAVPEIPVHFIEDAYSFTVL